MDFDAYARTAVALVNTPLRTLDDARELFPPGGWQRGELTDRDLAMLRRGQRRLREIFALGAAGRDAEVVAGLNALLGTYPVRPRISGHDATTWHMHVTGRGSSVAAEYLAGAVWGLSVWLCRFGSARFGICADARCGNVYLDTSSNNCRRFCCERCATRSHVAAHRARRRAATPAATPSAGTSPAATPSAGPPAARRH
ncbi:MAG: CGNR zinc finger domain-containing protein, partial [Micromonosporaceae bacterium]